MKKQVLIISILTLNFMSVKMVSQKKVNSLNEVVVTATKTKVNKKNIGKIVYKITSESIDNSRGKSLVDLLNDISGVEISGNYSNKGQNLSYFIRGGRTEQVAILIDGINVNDPSLNSGGFDLRQINLDQVESIEVLKGASSILYGTGAATGVINIILKKGSKKEFGFSFITSVGSNRAAKDQKIAADDFESSFNFNGTIGKIDYLLGVSANNSRGLSALESKDKNKLFKEDNFKKENVLLKLGYAINKKLKIGVFGSFDDFSADYDGFGVDADNNSKSKQKRAGLSANYQYKKGDLKVKTFFTDIKRSYTPTLRNYKGKAYGFDVYNNYNITNQVSFLVGLTTQYQDMFQKDPWTSIKEGSVKQYFYDPYISVNYNSDFGFNFNVGGRLNIHSEYGSNFIYNVNPSYNFDISESANLKFFASYSTAFITPSMYKIFKKSPALSELKPEKDATIEGGFELNLFNNLMINGTYFYREETDKVGYNEKFEYIINNLGTFDAKGFEAELTYKPLKYLQLLANYTYINRDKNLLVKIPKNKFNVKVNYKIVPSIFTSLSYQFVDKRKGYKGVDLPSYNVLDFFINHKLHGNKVTLFGNVTNILNQDYQEIVGYTTRGRNYKIGIRFQF